MGIPQKLRCSVVQIRDHGDHVYSLELKPERQAPNFLPGQFMHLAIDPYEPGDFWPESRVFSIASSPAQRDRLAITYSVAGSFTKKMEQRVHVGSVVWVKLPYGDFMIRNKGKVVLIAGGTGITAYTAFLEGLSSDHEQSVTLFYGARSPGLLTFKPMVERKMNEVKAFSAWYFIEEGEADEKCHLLSGRISVESLITKVVHPFETDFYLSGPPAMLAKLTLDLKSYSINPDHIILDAWA
ncbi:MAG: FAD-dependent oxidoreductase [Chloroflexi bacterium]|nr:FAD-dependent oxidoreductase [Chloroflexota bacterium]